MGVYGSGKVCPYENQECDPETEGMNLEPEIEEQMAENRDYDQLAYYWQKWRDATGRVYRLDSGLVSSNLNTLRKQSSSSGQITRATSTSRTRRPSPTSSRTPQRCGWTHTPLTSTPRSTISALISRRCGRT